MQDDDLFASEMSGVTPLKREPRERLVKTEAVDVTQRRRSATQSGAHRNNHLSDERYLSWTAIGYLFSITYYPGICPFLTIYHSRLFGIVADDLPYSTRATLLTLSSGVPFVSPSLPWY